MKKTASLLEKLKEENDTSIEDRTVGHRDCPPRAVFQEYINLLEKNTWIFDGVSEVGVWNELNAEAQVLAVGLQRTVKRLRALLKGKILDIDEYEDPYK